MEVDGSTAESGAGMTPSTSSSSSEKSVMASNGTQGTVSVSLHPLVIMNISEHWTRSKAQSGSPRQVYGAIIGKQKGRDIEIMNSFELDYNLIEEKVIIDMEYYKAKEEQFKQVFTDMDFLGWYSTGEAPSMEDIEIHRQITEFNESPLFLQMNPLARQSDLPVNMYESLFDLVGGHGMLFVKLSFTLATEEAERIGLDHVARISREEDDSNYSKVSEHVVVQHSAIKMLASRVRVILDYVKAVQAGDLPHNHEILREAKALSDRLPVLESSRFKPEFYSQYNDVALMTYLGSILKSSNNLNQYVNKLNILFPRQGTCRRMRGLFF